MSDGQRLFLLFGLLALGGLLYLLAPVLTPFAVSALLAYMGDPLVDRLERRLPRWSAVTLVFLVIFAALALIVLVLLPLVEAQMTKLVARLPEYWARIQASVFPWLENTLGLKAEMEDLGALPQILAQHWREAGGVAKGVVAAVSKSGLALLGWLANLVLIPVITFYLLRDWDLMLARIRELLPRRAEPTVVRLARDSDQVLGAFLRGQLLVMTALALVYSLGLALVGLDFALLVGLVAGLVSFVPYLGFLVGITLAGVAALLQFQDPIMLLPVAAVFAVGQALEGMVLTPLLVGDRIGLHPVAVIFAVLAGGQLFGFFGVLLALPVAAVVMVILRYAHERYLNSRLYAP